MKLSESPTEIVIFYKKLYWPKIMSSSYLMFGKGSTALLQKVLSDKDSMEVSVLFPPSNRVEKVSFAPSSSSTPWTLTCRCREVAGARRRPRRPRRASSLLAAEGAPISLETWTHHNSWGAAGLSTRVLEKIRCKFLFHYKMWLFALSDLCKMPQLQSIILSTNT